MIINEHLRIEFEVRSFGYSVYSVLTNAYFLNKKKCFKFYINSTDWYDIAGKKDQYLWENYRELILENIFDKGTEI